MNLLLLLSALLSALTGAHGQMRAAAVPVAVSRTAERVGVAAVRPVSGRPIVALPRASGTRPLSTALVLVPTAPVWLSRRRE